jgi:tripartite-type tricarboxylate transporter receptor subunit TctC
MKQSRRQFVLNSCGLAAALAGLPLAAQAQSRPYPNRSIEVVVPFGAGGGTDALARVFADAARKHISQPLTIVNKPGASGAIGFADVINDRSEGYKLALITVELAILPHLGIVKFQADDLVPIVRMNADPSAVTVRADAPWNTVEEFLEASRKAKGQVKVGNAGNGSIWHLAAVALEQKANLNFNHIPFQGGGPAVLSLLGGHLDAVTVSPAEVSSYVASGKLKTLAVMADRRVKGFEKVPTLKERGIDLSIGTWRGLAAPKGTPPDVLAVLSAAASKTANEPAVREALDKMNLGFSFADGATFKGDIALEGQYFKQLTSQLNFKN